MGPSYIASQEMSEAGLWFAVHKQERERGQEHMREQKLDSEGSGVVVPIPHCDVNVQFGSCACFASVSATIALSHSPKPSLKDLL
jgi:hypothetical protein